jgi:microcystin-dependent protein
MAQIKNWQDGASGDSWTSAGTLNITGSLELDGSVGTAGQVLVSNGTATPTWGNAFVTGMIMLWSGSTGSVPSGWRLCDGGGGTPDLRNRFVVGAGSTYAVDATGGSANAVVVSHSHGASTTVNTKTGLNGTLTLLNRGGSSGAQSLMRARSGSVTYASSGQGNYGTGWEGEGGSNSSKATFTLNHNHSASTSVSSAGSSGTNKNLPPYYALAYIMKL